MVDSRPERILYEPPPRPSQNLLSVLKVLSESPDKKRSLSNRLKVKQSIPRLTAVKHTPRGQSNTELPPLKPALTQRDKQREGVGGCKTHRKMPSYGGPVSSWMLESMLKQLRSVPVSAPPEPEKKRLSPKSQLRALTRNLPSVHQKLLKSMKGLSDAALVQQLNRYNAYL